MPLSAFIGHVLNKTDGFTVECTNKKCDAQEACGYGSSIEKAYEIVKDKMKFTKGM
jgi:hypothetical protein